MKRIVLKLSLVAFVIAPLWLSSCLSPAEEVPDFNEQLQKDIATIDAYLAAKNITAQTHVSGLRYVVHSEGGGNRPTQDSCVVTNYIGKYLSTELKFDEGNNFSLPLNGVIDGFKIGIPLLHEGDSATLYVPSGLAYGYYGYGSIPSNANLFFGVKVLKVGRVYSVSPSPKGSCN